jgi:hypothetical protein
MNDYSEEIDSLDAAVFSGEILYTHFEEFQICVARWQRAIDEHREALRKENI